VASAVRLPTRQVRGSKAMGTSRSPRRKLASSQAKKHGELDGSFHHWLEQR
jgi:hypothetical protein